MNSSRPATHSRRPAFGQPTLLSRLAGAGYRIGYTGKWHLPREGDGALWGVHHWHTSGEWSRSLAQQGYDFARDEVQRLEWGGSAPFAGRNTLPAEQTQEAWTADRAIEMIDAFGGGDAPFSGRRLLLRTPLPLRRAGAVRHHVRPRPGSAAGELR